MDYGLTGNEMEWPKSKEMKEAIAAIKKTGKVRFVGSQPMTAPGQGARDRRPRGLDGRDHDRHESVAGEGLSTKRGGKAEVFDLELEGVRATLLPTTSSRPDRAPAPREGALYLDLADQVFERFRPDVLLTYGGHPVSLELIESAVAIGSAKIAPEQEPSIAVGRPDFVIPPRRSSGDYPSDQAFSPGQDSDTTSRHWPLRAAGERGHEPVIRHPFQA